MFLTITQIVFLLALAAFMLTSDAVSKKISAVTVAVTAVVWAVVLMVGIL